MESLNFFGIAIFFTIGVMTGAAIMYFGGLIIDKTIDREEETP